MSANRIQTELTDDELIAMPPRLLTREQRIKRRYVKNNRAKAKTRRRRREAAETGQEKRTFCQATKRDGSKCTAYACISADHCFQHLTEDERTRLNMIRKPPNAGANLTAPQLARDVIEVAVLKVLKPYTDALGFEIVGVDEDGQPILRDLGERAGLMLHGESKDGYVHMSKYPDTVGRVQIAEKLQDRVYGRPRQTTVLEGGQKPIQVQPVRTEVRAQEMARLLGHLGVGVSAPELNPAPDDIAGEAFDVEENGQVVPLRGDPE